MTLTELQPVLTTLDKTDKLRAMQFLASELANELTEFTPPDSAWSITPPLSKTDALSAPEDPADQALAFYEAELQPILEPGHNGESVAIHLDTRSYEVAKGVGHAYRALRAKQPVGSIVVHRIGIADAGLAARMKGERYE